MTDWTRTATPATDFLEKGNPLTSSSTCNATSTSIFKHWQPVELVFVVATLAATGVSLLQQPMCQATGILVEESFEYFDNPRLSSVDKIVVRYYAPLAHRDGMETRVIEALSSSLGPAAKQPGHLLSRVTVREDSENPVLFRITAQADTAEKASLIANPWAEQYMEEIAGYQPGWGSQFEQAEQELEAAEAVLTAFRKETGVGLAGGVVAAFVLEYFEDLRNKRSVHSQWAHFVAPGLLRSLSPRSRVFDLRPADHQVDAGFTSFAA